MFGDIMDLLLFAFAIFAPYAIALIGATMISKAILTKVRKARALVGFLIFIMSFIAIVFACFYILGIMGLTFAR